MDVSSLSVDELWRFVHIGVLLFLSLRGVFRGADVLMLMKTSFSVSLFRLVLPAAKPRHIRLSQGDAFPLCVSS